MKYTVLVLLVWGWALSAFAQEVKGNFPSWQRRGPIRDAVGVKGGLIAQGDIYINSRPYRNKFGLHGGIFFDFHVAKKFFISPTIDIIDINLFEQRQMFLDASLSIKKGILSKHQRILWRPTASVGYGYMADIGFLKLTSFLTLKTSCELIFVSTKRYTYLFELGLIGLPAGGNREYEVRANPHLFLRAGVMY